jgi:hypothetical protein
MACIIMLTAFPSAPGHSVLQNVVEKRQDLWSSNLFKSNTHTHVYIYNLIILYIYIYQIRIFMNQMSNVSHWNESQRSAGPKNFIRNQPLRVSHPREEDQSHRTKDRWVSRPCNGHQQGTKVRMGEICCPK